MESHHPLVHKLSVIRTLFHRADSVPQDQGVKVKEKQHIKQALAKCGYPNWSFTKTENPKPQDRANKNSNTENTRQRVNVTIPYVHNLSDKIKRLFGKHSISTLFKAQNTLRQKLVHVKDRVPKERKRNVVMYMVSGVNRMSFMLMKRINP